LSGDRTFSRRPRPLRRTGKRTRNQCGACLAARIHLRGRFLPTMPEPIEPLTPLSPLLLTYIVQPPSRKRPSDVPFEPFRAVMKRGGAARPYFAPNRERRRFVTIRGAFHRQGPFVGSGGHYNPGPAIAPPLLAMKQPLDDALTSPWALCRTSPFLLRRVRLAIRRFARGVRRRFHADDHSDLGPRSLDPDRPFGDAFAERI
jgi:hypothetical protein